MYKRLAWTEQYDETTGQLYYVNTEAGLTQWEAPDDGFEVYQAEAVATPEPVDAQESPDVDAVEPTETETAAVGEVGDQPDESASSNQPAAVVAGNGSDQASAESSAPITSQESIVLIKCCPSLISFLVQHP